MTKRAKDSCSDSCVRLKKEKDILQNMVNCPQHIHLVYFDRDFNIVRVNQAYAETCGYKPEEMIGKNHFSLYSNKETEAIFRYVRSTGVPARFHDKPFVFPDQPDRGVTYWDWTLDPIKDDSGKVEGLVFSLVETSERKKAEQALKESEDRFSKAFHANPTAMAITDINGLFVNVNDSFQQLVGFTKDEVFEKRGTELGIYADPSERAEIIEQLQRTGCVSNFEMSFRHKYGKLVRVIFSMEKITFNEKPHFLGTAIDITERKKAEDALRISVEKFSKAFKNSPNAVTITRLSDGRIIDANDSVFNILGYEPKEAIGKSTLELNIWAMDDRIKLAQTLATKGFVNDLELVLLRKDGTKVTVNLSASLVKIQNEQYILSSFIDITARKKAEEELKRSKEQEHARRLELEAIMETVPATMWFAHDAKCSNVTGNKATYDLLRLPFGVNVSETTISNTEHFLAYRDDKPASPCDLPMQVAARSGKSVLGSEFELRFADGRRVWLYGNAVPLVNDKGVTRGAIGAFVDVSIVKKMNQKIEEYTKNLEGLVEERTKALKDAERLATIGTTAGMVGHDIRNPLQAITSDVYLAKTELASTLDSEEKKNVLESLDEIENNVVYINKIVADLQDYARPIKPFIRDVNLQNTLENILMKNDIPANIKVKVKVQKNAGLVIADPDILNRVMSNLMINAVQAMPEGGKLTITANKEANGITITVQDTGLGIPEDARSKMFTPLFTTKSKGQGFGLAVVKRLTETMGGTVTFESQTGKGTKFTVKFPQERTIRHI